MKNMLEKINFDKFEPILAKYVTSDINVLASVSPFIKKSQFKDEALGFLVHCFKSFYVKNKKLLNAEQLELYFANKAEENIIKEAFNKINGINLGSYDQDLLLKDTEQFIKEREIWNSLLHIAKKLDNNTITSEEVLKIVEKVCNISLDEEESYLDLFNDIDKVLEAIKEKNSVISTGYPTLDKIIDGGFYKDGKALYMFMAPPNKGKSLLLGNIASNLAEMGKTVLLISLEMSEVAYASRFCSQLCSIPFAELHLHSDKVKPVFENQTGKIIIKEFPTGQKTVEQIKLWTKKNIYDCGIKPDVILIDYINLIAGDGDTMYEKIKIICEKVRAMSYFFKTPVVSVTQQNRCLTEDTGLRLEDNSLILIKDVKVGDKIQGKNKIVTVTHKFKPEIQKVYQIKTKSGKLIKCSENHIFPTISGEKSISTGLTVGDKLFVSAKNFLKTIIEDEIVEIIELDFEKTYDISVSGDHLFFANDILTHNSADGQKMSGLNSVGESMGISATADFLGEIFFNEEDRILNIIRVGVAKNRYGQVGISFALKSNYETLRITDLEEEDNFVPTAIMEIGRDLELFSS